MPIADIEPLATDILKLEKQVLTVEEKIKAATKEPNEQIELLYVKIHELKAEIDQAAEPFHEPFERLERQIQDKKDVIASCLQKEGKKTVELDIATVKMRTTNSVEILDKVGLVKALSKIHNGIEEGVATFVKGHIGALIKSKALDESIAGFTEKRKVSITAKEPTGG